MTKEQQDRHSALAMSAARLASKANPLIVMAGQLQEYISLVGALQAHAEDLARLLNDRDTAKTPEQLPGAIPAKAQPVS